MNICLSRTKSLLNVFFAGCGLGFSFDESIAKNEVKGSTKRDDEPKDSNDKINEEVSA